MNHFELVFKVGGEEMRSVIHVTFDPDEKVTPEEVILTAWRELSSAFDAKLTAEIKKRLT